MKSTSSEPPLSHPIGVAAVGDHQAERRSRAAAQLAGIFVHPIRLFEQLRQRPASIAPLLVAIGAGILVLIALPDQVFVDGMQGATTRRGVPVEITSAPEVVARWERMRLSLGVVFTHPVKAALLAGLTTLLFGGMGGGARTFVRHFSVAAHALLISVVGTLLILPLQIAAVDGAIGPSLGLLVPGLETLGLGGRILAGFNPFTAWMLGVMALGVGVVDRRSPRLPAVVLLGAYMALLTSIAAVQG